MTSMAISEQGRSELVKVADEIAYNVEDRDRLIDSFMQIINNFSIPKFVAREILETALRKRGLADRTIRYVLPEQLIEKRNRKNPSEDIDKIDKVDDNNETEQSQVIPIPIPVVTDSDPKPEPEEQQEPVETVKKQEREKYEHETIELREKLETLTNDNRELKKALADKTAFQAASQITPRQDLVSENKSLRQEKEELTQELEAVKQQKALEIQPQPLELEMDTFWDTFVILFLPKNRGKTLKIIHDGSRVQQVMIWKSDKAGMGVKNK